ncbi:hypothetical protein A2334_00245 [Candidatus Roizmanbacteria bacterium RIFOXYB2_FULL_38_10]|uniref:Uncharacterized protein n=1 Tax=Candidatus Roizmanbacteria bacterium RIFOXYD1_FULL_38_12 TaxID=1802093 RepID=A0A1F7L2B1_9BACT|nr:MAG: hypothetical protein A3K47_05790 [Candidatus Roizmanbacteria bacterium RIFOXYA2_FULL_38_14]OGK64254.1 MAG: hypothetical protein A3K27_05790 [Candidatus Roizmanbacteria bacterium RIFOXYA1_FULL_37_12]OGK66100.1 MAG: hypothetical protein A3K38_05790 [Candidatus Roizmanbacteria bacterium RIFOXYB1_FULL_40_23]OGK67665.1 MAG: hypothetical protein A2334_00245 [Candidatus Roizmanbacteria bacterium RIFOXYB2_FULL_38_10]OGK70505.1 MAG: hypothetical protein A3K21_05795 [Candidatus Roizmanbacteria ba
MRKGIASVLVLLIVLVIGGAGVLTTLIFFNKGSSDEIETTTKQSSQVSTGIFKDQTDLCHSLPMETVALFLGKTIVRTESITDITLQSCQYYLDETHALVINHDLTNVASKLKGHETLDRTITTNKEIDMEHAIIIQENGLINEIYLIFNDSEFVSINRPNGKLISEEEIVDFSARLVDFLKNGKTQTNKTPETKKTVSLPQEEAIVQNFFGLINERKIPEAVSLMSKNMVGNDSIKQAWGVQFNDIKSINVQKIEQSIPNSWSENSHIYKVTLEVYVSSSAANAPIPYYGWGDNPNIRWIEIVKEDGIWKINNLATGP